MKFINLESLRIVAGAIIMALLFFKFNEYVLISLALTGIIVCGYDIFIKAIGELRHLSISENVLMCIGAVAAFLIKEYPESVAILLFFLIGEEFEDYAKNKSRGMIENLAKLRPKIAHIVENNTLVDVAPKKVKIGQVIRVLKGERIPLDGILLSNVASIDSSAISGESVPITVEKGNAVISGGINLSESFDIEVNKGFRDSSISELLDLVENASNAKSKQEHFITTFAKYYTPIVVAIAAILALLPCFIPNASFEDYVVRALVFLVVSCPCALLLAIPLAFFGGLGVLAKREILVKGSHLISSLSKVNFIALDKTGTLTQGVFGINHIESFIKFSSLKKIAEGLEINSNHPLAKSIVLAFKDENAKLNVTEKVTNEKDLSLNDNEGVNFENITEIVGFGIKGDFNHETYYAVSQKYALETLKLSLPEDLPKSTVIIASNKAILGIIVLEDRLKSESKSFIKMAKNIGISLELLSGDNKNIVKNVADKLGIENSHGDLTPKDKLEIVEAHCKENSKTIGFVGDGINDAPVLSRADIGFVMGKVGQAIAIDAGDVIIVNDNLHRILEAKIISSRIMNLVKLLLVFILGVKFIILIMGALGFASIWLAIFGDVGVTVIAVLIAMVTFREKFARVNLSSFS